MASPWPAAVAAGVQGSTPSMPCCDVRVPKRAGNGRPEYGCGEWSGRVGCGRDASRSRIKVGRGNQPPAQPVHRGYLAAHTLAVVRSEGPPASLRLLSNRPKGDRYTYATPYAVVGGYTPGKTEECCDRLRVDEQGTGEMPKGTRVMSIHNSSERPSPRNSRQLAPQVQPCLRPMHGTLTGTVLRFGESFSHLLTSIVVVLYSVL